MSIKKVLRTTLGANVSLLITFILLPALVITNDISMLQSTLDFMNRE